MEKEKKALRLEMMQARLALSEEQKERNNKHLEQLAISLIQNKSARTVHIYLSLAEEIATQGIIDYCWNKGIKIIVPKTLKAGLLKHLHYQCGDRLSTGSFECKWPSHNKEHKGEIDLIICPGLAFDHSGNRLGYGGGYYDRFLAEHSEAYKVALAHDFQVFSKIPNDAHDCKMDEILVAKEV